MRQTIRRAFPSIGSDGFGGFGFDQLLQRPTGELTDQIGPVSNAERVEQFGYGRLW